MTETEAGEKEAGDAEGLLALEAVEHNTLSKTHRHFYDRHTAVIHIVEVRKKNTHYAGVKEH